MAVDNATQGQVAVLRSASIGGALMCLAMLHNVIGRGLTPEPGRMASAMVRTLRPVRLTKDRARATIHVGVVRDLTHKAGLWLLIRRLVW